MVDGDNYADDIWKTCLDEKGKRYKRKDIKNSLKKLVVLGLWIPRHHRLALPFSFGHHGSPGLTPSDEWSGHNM